MTSATYMRRANAILDADLPADERDEQLTLLQAERDGYFASLQADADAETFAFVSEA